MKYYIITFLILFTMAHKVFADSGKPVYNVLIDTDGALDDFRAINMFLAGKDFNVLGITTSQGTLAPAQSFEKISSLLSSYYHDGIPVGTGVGTSMSLPAWSGFTNSIQWAKGPAKAMAMYPAFDVIEQAVSHCTEKVTLVALGPLTTYAHWLKSTKQQTDRIEQIIWYAGADLSGEFNYQADSKAYTEIVHSSIPLTIVSKGQNSFPITEAYLSMLNKTDGIYSKNIKTVLTSPVVQEKLKKGHSQLWDDLVPLYLAHPDLFQTDEQKDFKMATLKANISKDVVLGDIQQIFRSKTEAMNRVFMSFPLQKNSYKGTYANMLENTIHQFGLAEWKAVTLTNEVHGHTGIYSIIGAKAGIRACEYFNVGVNNLYAVSYAGNQPPLSCFNDGIQISTGATIGQGMITVSDTVLPTPTITFSFNGRKAKFTLKGPIAKKMQQDIKTGVEKFGLSVPYWAYIEDLARDYWANFNRHDIFVIENLE